MDSIKFKQRDFVDTLTLLCHAKAGDLLRAGKINQSEIGRIAGTSQVNISRWLKRENQPTNENISKLAKAFKLTPAQIRGEMPINGIDGLNLKSAEDERLLKEFMSLPEEAKNLIREQIRVYKKLSD